MNQTDTDTDKSMSALDIGEIKRSITAMPMAPYWQGLIANSKHITFRTAIWKGPITKNKNAFGSEGRTVWTITPISVTATGKILLVAVRSFKVSPTGSRQGKSDEFNGEHRVALGSYVDVVRQVAYEMGIPVKPTHIEYV
jgi:hypothetical protein